MRMKHNYNNTLQKRERCVQTVSKWIIYLHAYLSMKADKILSVYIELLQEMNRRRDKGIFRLGEK